MSTSVSYDNCKHKKTSHSPDGFDCIEECKTCLMAWLIKGITGEVIRLTNSSYETRLIKQAIAKAEGNP
jgi:hypothetical protein